MWIEIFWLNTKPVTNTSLPTRECGLKSLNIALSPVHLSHSLRGSVDWNYLIARHKPQLLNVTPYAGVWIEIRSPCVYSVVWIVTPYAGVWIEIGDWCKTWVFERVTPYAGVWIEIFFRTVNRSWITSLPTRECGLKLAMVCVFVTLFASLPTRECGLKSVDLFQWIYCYSHSLRGSVDWNTLLY